MKKINNIDDFVSIIIIIFFILIGTLSVSAQGYTVHKVDDNYEINFIDEFADQWYLNGEEIIRYGELTLSEKDYKQLIKDIKKTLKKSEAELIKPNYELIKYSWVNDSVWVYKNEKAFSVTKKDLEYLNSKL
jgi:hypothetical protein|tara:strand:+ start:1081 stop:1476 length:396 start_codon:yes stop_codon:yes gene_type:complete